MSFVFVVALFAASLLEKTAFHFNATNRALPPKNVAMSNGVRWREKTDRGGAILFSILCDCSLTRKSYTDGREAVSGASGGSAKS